MTGVDVPVATEIGAVPVTLVTLDGSAVLCHVVPFEVRTLPLVPGATVWTALVPLPRITLLATSVVAPVPPLATVSVPEVIVAALRGGMSEALKVEPEVTRPLVSNVTLVDVPPDETLAKVAVADPALNPDVVTSPVRAVT